jgi:hypothetical protein
LAQPSGPCCARRDNPEAAGFKPAADIKNRLKVGSF